MLQTRTHRQLLCFPVACSTLWAQLGSELWEDHLVNSVMLWKQRGGWEMEGNIFISLCFYFGCVVSSLFLFHLNLLYGSVFPFLVQNTWQSQFERGEIYFWLKVLEFSVYSSKIETSWWKGMIRTKLLSSWWPRSRAQGKSARERCTHQRPSPRNPPSSAGPVNSTCSCEHKELILTIIAPPRSKYSSRSPLNWSTDS